MFASSEGGPFEYGSNDETIANLLASATNTALFMVGLVTRSDETNSDSQSHESRRNKAARFAPSARSSPVPAGS